MKKLEYQIPFEEGANLSGLLEKLEQEFPNLSIAIEQTSLEDAYLKIAELNNRGTVREQMTDEEFREKLDGYLKSKGSYSRCR